MAVDTLPDGLRPFAATNPITYTVGALGGLTTGDGALGALLADLAWFAAILAVVGSLAVRRHHRTG